MADNPKIFCDALDEWAKIMSAKSESFAKDWNEIRFLIHKSCLLSRTIYGGEKPSQTKCPVHDGKWQGCHVSAYFTTPMSTREAEWKNQPEWAGKTLIELGCRCNQHRCGCTTGWQPDEHCGCGIKP